LLRERETHRDSVALIRYLLVEPGSLVGMDRFARGMFEQIQHPPLDRHLTVEVRAPGEWIVGLPAGGRSLHVYRLAPADWLVSEVGCRDEGRGTDLKQALAALSAGLAYPDWWDLVGSALEDAAGGSSTPANVASGLS